VDHCDKYAKNQDFCGLCPGERNALNYDHERAIKPMNFLLEINIIFPKF
jgi:hypothetical protein